MITFPSLSLSLFLSLSLPSPTQLLDSATVSVPSSTAGLAAVRKGEWFEVVEHKESVLTGKLLDLVFINSYGRLVYEYEF